MKQQMNLPYIQNYVHISVISNETTNEFTIYGKLCRHFNNIQSNNKQIYHICKTVYVERSQYFTIFLKSFFISSAGKIQSVRKFKMKFFNWLFHSG